MKTVKDVLGIAADLEKQCADAREEYGSLAESDPELWEHWFFGDDIIGDMRKYKPAGTQEETDAFRALYRQLKVMIDECLLPSGLCEARSVLFNGVSPFLGALAGKNAVVASEIAEDMYAHYPKSENEDARDFAQDALARVKRAMKKAAGHNPGDGPLSGQTIVFTGELSTMSRDDATAAAFNRGAQVVNGVSKKTSLVVIGDRPGGKAIKAKELGVRTLDEDQWRSMIGLPKRTFT